MRYSFAHGGTIGGLRRQVAFFDAKRPKTRRNPIRKATGACQDRPGWFTTKTPPNLDTQGSPDMPLFALHAEWSLIKRILAYFKPYKFRIAVSTVAMLLVALTTAAAAYLVQPLLDYIFINKRADYLFILPFLYIFIVGVKGVSRFIQGYFMSYCGMKVLEQLRNELFSKVIALPVSFFDEQRVGNLMSRIINDVMQIRTSLPSFIMMVRQVLTMIFLIALIIYRDAYLAAFALLVLPVGFYPFIWFGKRLRRLGKKSQSLLADIATVLQEVLSGVKVVKAFATEDRERERFNREDDRLISVALHQTKYSEMSSPIMEFIGAIAVGLVICYGGFQVIEGHSTPGKFFSFLAALILLYEPFKYVSRTNNQIQLALAAAERVFEIIDSSEMVVEKDGTVEFKGPVESLEFDSVSFTYPGTERPALDGVDLSVSAGERIAIVGPSGAGKTTLINLLPRFYDPNSGQIRLNGRPIEDYTLTSLRRSIGMVSQDAFLFNISVHDNIAYATPGISREEVVEAAKAAYAHEFIEALPDGYDTLVGERGVRLSGGQKQRMTIARALLKNPPLLILDEATSALDTEAERIVQMALDNLMKGRTSIVIAHRLSTILSADSILVLQGGRLVDSGKHADLLETSPLYSKLYNMQYRDDRLDL
jgi:subfamily B ATP-binding cassette protein MsbA